MAKSVVLSSKELEAAARALYDSLTTPRPSWEQLGDVTKSYWRDEVGKRALAAANPSVKRTKKKR